MKLQTIQLNGADFVLIPAKSYKAYKVKIDSLLAESEDDEELIPFVLEDYFDNPIILARMRAGITQHKLAKLLYVSQSYISQLEKDDKVSSAVMFKVKQALKDYPDRWVKIPKS